MSLQKVFHTTPDDLAHNRNGTLSANQLRHLHARMAPARTVSYLVLIAIMMAVGAIAVVAVVTNNTLIAIFIGALGGYVAMRSRTISLRLMPSVEQDISEKKVRSVHGKVRLEDGVLRVQKHRFQISKAQAGAFHDGQRVTVYYTLHSRTVVAAEEVD